MNDTSNITRRSLLIGGVSGLGIAGYCAFQRYQDHPLIARGFDSLVNVGIIGVGGRGLGLGFAITPLARITAMADVDRAHLDIAKQQLYDTPEAYRDYRDLLERDDISAVIIATPTHWHAKIAGDAMKAGKDVYCEKPLTLTVAEGAELINIAKSTARVLQVGTQQRSDPRFWHTCQSIRRGALGQIKKITIELPGVTWEDPGPFAQKTPPDTLDWDFWLGSAPAVDYQNERCHNWRYWYDYEGGRLTGWGAHYVDIANLALPESKNYPLSVTGECNFTGVKGGYDAPRTFDLRYQYPDNVEVVVRGRNDFEFGNEPGILFESVDGTFYINRSSRRGDLEDDVDSKPPKDPTAPHLINFLQCVRDRRQPISDVVSSVNVANACHIGNISLRLGRSLEWDHTACQFVNDDVANSMLSRESRSVQSV
jgi:myo-inositol 2-dehydrogenase / D-chiro-inositol 1-dehydrogenase